MRSGVICFVWSQTRKMVVFWGALEVLDNCVFRSVLSCMCVFIFFALVFESTQLIDLLCANEHVLVL